VANENAVPDGHPFTNKGVARNLAPRANFRAFLNFDEAADPCFIADLATIQVHKAKEPDSLTKPDV
jgi:hypothetical protein